MNALILCAGMGSRLMPITRNNPKPLVRIGGKPLLEYWINSLKKCNIDKIYINTFFQSKKIENFLKKKNYSQVSLIFEKKLKGTAGTLLENFSLFENDDLILIHGDNFTTYDLNKLVNFHKFRKNNSEISLIAFKTDNSRDCGMLEMNSEKIVIKYEEKPSSTNLKLANGAVYILSKKSLKNIKENFYDSKDFSKEIIPKFVGSMQAQLIEDFFIDIGNRKNLYLARKYINSIL